MDNIKKENIYLFPGFSQSKTLYGDYLYMNIWEEKYAEHDLVDVKYILGHSMGTLSALMNWVKNPNTTIILFNPLVVKRNYVNLFCRFALMILTSPGTSRAVKGHTSFKYLFIAIRNAVIFLKTDAIKILKQIPKDKLIIIKGEKDKFFCDKESLEALRKSGVSFIELKGVGHYWVPEVDEYIKQFIK